jgi:uncharacterized protein YecE (DUF72 family)
MSASVPRRVYIGTAGWQLPKEIREPEAEGSQLEQYARVFNAVEINSTFYRPHRPATFERWAASVPSTFRFAVKLHRGITHEQRLRVTDEVLLSFLGMVSHLGDRLGPVLVQLPPSLPFDAVAEDFLEQLRTLYGGEVVVEPRHRSWAGQEADRLLARLRMARVAADPPPLQEDVRPGGHRMPAYFRLHGSPRMYRSAYTEERLRAFAADVSKAPGDAWVIFDNTAEGAAATDAMKLMELLRVEALPPERRVGA